MQILYRLRGVDQPDVVKSYTERRIGFALGRFADQIVRVTATIGDNNGPRGGVDKRCRISVRLRRSEPLTVTAEASTLPEAIDLGAERAKRAVVRRLERLQVRRSASALK